MLDNHEPARSLGWFIPCYLPLRVNMGGTIITLAGFPVPMSDKDDSSELFAGLMNGTNKQVMLIWRERFIGLAGRFDNGQAWVQHIGQKERLVPNLRLGAHQLLSEHIAARLNGITLDDDWQPPLALDLRPAGLGVSGGGSMNARTISYVLDGLAVKLREGLNQEGYGLQDAARRLRELGEVNGTFERDHDTYKKATVYVDESIEALQSIVLELENARWNINFSVRPRVDVPDPIVTEDDPDDIPF